MATKSPEKYAPSRLLPESVSQVRLSRTSRFLIYSEHGMATRSSIGQAI